MNIEYWDLLIIGVIVVGIIAAGRMVRPTKTDVAYRDAARSVAPKVDRAKADQVKEDIATARANVAEDLPHVLIASPAVCGAYSPDPAINEAIAKAEERRNRDGGKWTLSMDAEKIIQDYKSAACVAVVGYEGTGDTIEDLIKRELLTGSPYFAEAIRREGASDRVLRRLVGADRVIAESRPDGDYIPAWILRMTAGNIDHAREMRDRLATDSASNLRFVRKRDA